LRTIASKITRKPVIANELLRQVRTFLPYLIRQQLILARHRPSRHLDLGFARCTVHSRKKARWISLSHTATP
jgi:hypothetical protein